MSTRYLSKIGATPRLMVITTLLGAREIHVVGMDGYPLGVKNYSDSKHSFQVGKKMGGFFNYNVFERHYTTLWHYLSENIGKGVNYVNLGQGHSYNMSTLMWEND